MSSDLKEKSLRAVKWTFIEAVGQRGIQFVIGIILARLLLPEQFGLIGMLLVFIAVSRVFLDSGFGGALIQRQDVSIQDFSTIFYFNILVGTTTAVILCLCAPWVASFYNQPLLTPLLRVLSLILIVEALGLIQIVLIRRELDFKTEAKVSLIAGLLSGIVGVSMAYSGFGVWSLVAQQLSGSITSTTLIWFFKRWRPIWTFNFSSLRKLFGFGSKMLASSFLNQVFGHIYFIVIGRVFSPAALGFYSRADNLQKLPSTTIANVIMKVSFAAFSTIQDDLARVKRGTRTAITTLAMINFPLMIGLAAVARPLVIVLLTDKWAPTIPYLQVLCIVGLLYPLQQTNLNIVGALGRSDLFFYYHLINKLLIAINIALTWKWGIMAMISGHVLVTGFGYLINAYYNKKLITYTYKEQFQDIFPYLAGALLMGAVVFSLSFLTIDNLAFLLAAQVSIGAGIYVLICNIWRLSAFLDVQQIVLQRFSLRRS